MLFEKEKNEQKHRVIGIRHALKSLKEDGLIDDETMYPDRAVKEVKDEILKTAQKWYRIGARRGGNEVLEAFFTGKFSLMKIKAGVLEITANTKHIMWERSLKVRVGNNIKKIPKKKYRLGIKELGFE